mmetsp:Transcript_34102/g.53175  ORF Transcript_34102/g.53175 Transcript_34102/m.53175 type:complete len:293 (-) Transcript_34102:192-1070(-)
MEEPFPESQGADHLIVDPEPILPMAPTVQIKKKATVDTSTGHSPEPGIDLSPAARAPQTMWDRRQEPRGNRAEGRLSTFDAEQFHAQFNQMRPLIVSFPSGPWSGPGSPTALSPWSRRSKGILLSEKMSSPGRYPPESKLQRSPGAMRPFTSLGFEPENLRVEVARASSSNSSRQTLNPLSSGYRRTSENVGTQTTTNATDHSVTLECFSSPKGTDWHLRSAYYLTGSSRTASGGAIGLPKLEPLEDHDFKVLRPQKHKGRRPLNSPTRQRPTPPGKMSESDFRRKLGVLMN